MNLIEQLGGYEKAKQQHEESLPLVQNGYKSQGLESIRLALLEYRRQHNIYEAGDWIVIDSHKPEYQLYQITKDDMGSQWINLIEFRHANDVEIKAGKRRPELDSDNCSDIRNHVSPLTKVIDR